MTSIHDRGAPNASTLTDGNGDGVTVAVVNPASGSAVSEKDLRTAFDELGRPLEWRNTTEDDPGAGQAPDAVASGATTVVACGGEGTVRACLAPLAGSDTGLGIVPLGTGNLLAANLELPSGLDAVERAVTGRVHRIDVAEVNGTTVFDARTAMVLVGNCGTVTGGIEVFPDARPDDDILDVAVLSARSPIEWASVLWRLVRGFPQRLDLVARYRGRRVAVRTATPRPYEVDGEVRPSRPCPRVHGAPRCPPGAHGYPGRRFRSQLRKSREIARCAIGAPSQVTAAEFARRAVARHHRAAMGGERARELFRLPVRRGIASVLFKARG